MLPSCIQTVRDGNLTCGLHSALVLQLSNPGIYFFFCFVFFLWLDQLYPPAGIKHQLSGEEGNLVLICSPGRACGLVLPFASAPG